MSADSVAEFVHPQACIVSEVRKALASEAGVEFRQPETFCGAHNRDALLFGPPSCICGKQSVIGDSGSFWCADAYLVAGGDSRDVPSQGR